MSFNPDPTKQAQDIIFSRKNYKDSHPDLVFNGCVVQKSNSQKHLGLYLDDTLSFKKHIKEAFDKTSKGINVLKRLFHYVPRSSLLTIYKSFVRPHLDYGDVIYHQPSNSNFSNTINLFNMMQLLQ